MSNPCRAAYTEIGRAVAKMTQPIATIAQNALAKPWFSANAAPMASSARNEMPPKAVLATRHSPHLRAARGV